MSLSNFSPDAITERVLVKVILEQALQQSHSARWAFQGFGMFRIHLENDLRLNIWSNKDKVNNVSDIHTHPWDFTSIVICGCLNNYIYQKTRYGVPYQYQLLKPGQGGGLLESPKSANIMVESCSAVMAGKHYEMQGCQIHRSEPIDLTVTLNIRKNRDPQDVAYTFWPDGTDWVSAIPRPADPSEIKRVARAVLDRWF